jgi:cell division protein FtsB
MTRRNQSRTKLVRWERASRGLVIVVGAAAGLMLVVSFFFDARGVPKYLEMRGRAERLTAEIAEIRKTNAELRAEIGRLQRDPARIEALARERLGFVRKGETVYQIVEDGPSGE